MSRIHENSRYFDYSCTQWHWQTESGCCNVFTMSEIPMEFHCQVIQGKAPLCLYLELWWAMSERNTNKMFITTTVECQNVLTWARMPGPLIGEESINPPIPTASSSFDNGKAVNSWTLIGNRSAFLRPHSWSQLSTDMASIETCHDQKPKP